MDRGWGGVGCGGRVHRRKGVFTGGGGGLTCADGEEGGGWHWSGLLGMVEVEELRAGGYGSPQVEVRDGVDRYERCLGCIW